MMTRLVIMENFCCPAVMEESKIAKRVCYYVTRGNISKGSDALKPDKPGSRRR